MEVPAMTTFRMIATSAPTAAQAATVDKLLLGAVASLVAQTPEDRRREVFDLAHAELVDALAGRPVRESAARMVAKAVELVGCRCAVVAA